MRDAKNIKQQEVAQHCGVSNSLISQYESSRTNPPDDIKVKLADFFNVSVDYLLGRETENGLALDKEVMRLPIVGTIKRAGEPILAVQNIEGYAVIERKYLKSG